MEYENSLKFKNPELSAQWHPSHNGKLTPEDVTTGSNKKVWWKCNKGHKWKATVKNRSHGRGCPFCSGNKVILGETDLATVNPNIAKEWHPTKNNELTARMVTPRSNKTVWWQCNKGHEWHAIIKNRSHGSGCPYCAGRKAILGETDLATVNPNIAREWHPTKNNDLTPTMVTLRSKKMVWWKCNKGHEWQATINNRSQGSGCLYCAGKKVLLGETDLATLNPNIAREWHPSKNNDLTPTMVTTGSDKTVWWLCSKGHEWQAAVYDRNRGNGCPYCSGSKAIPGKTDLHTANPILAQEWNYEKNSSLNPTELKANSGKKVWWVCSEGHEWTSRIADRNSGDGCPYCSGRLSIPGQTDLATVAATLAKQWHSTKNVDLKPANVKANSNKKVWWQCSKGHEWQATIADRNSGQGCPYCSGRRAILNETDLKTLNAALAQQWHPTKNRKLKPTMVTAGSNKKVWWQCSEGHEWQAIISNRNYGKGCPYCSGRLAIPSKTDLETLNPKLASEWHPVKNGKLKPKKVTAGSKKKVWWQCSEGHEWRASIKSRTSGSGCPLCIGKKRRTKKNIS